MKLIAQNKIMLCNERDNFKSKLYSPQNNTIQFPSEVNEKQRYIC